MGRQQDVHPLAGADAAGRPVVALRRALQVAAAILVSGLVAGLRHDALPFTGEPPPLGLGVAASERPSAVAAALLDALANHRALALEAVVLAAAAALLPLVRRREPWPIAFFGAAMMAGTLLAVPTAAALPLVAGTWLTCAALVAETRVGPIGRRSGR